MTRDDRYDNFEYPASQISKYLYSAGIFTLMLEDGKITHHSPDDVEAFLEWLQSHNINDVRQFIP